MGEIKAPKPQPLDVKTSFLTDEDFRAAMEEELEEHPKYRGKLGPFIRDGLENAYPGISKRIKERVQERRRNAAGRQG